MSKDSNNWDNDERFNTLFAAADHDALPPDPEFLARLRTRSTEVFLEQAAVPDQPDAHQRRHTMFWMTPRTWAAVAAALVVFVASWLWTQRDQDSSQKTLDVVLARLNDAQSLHLKLVRMGKPSDVWVAQPGRLRWNRPDGTYQIDDGRQLWDINERENQAVPQASQYFDGELPRLDVLHLVDIEKAEDQAALRAVQPTGRVTEDGVACETYEWTMQTDQGTMEVRAVVDASDEMLRSLRTYRLVEGKLNPVSELVVSAVNPPVDESLFKVASTLTVDGRIGKVVDRQGLVSVKPAAHARWTPIAEHLVLKPRDWIRTDLRGANAAALRLGSSIRLTLGPGTLAELETPQRVKLLSGEVKVVTDPDEPLTLIGPDNTTTTLVEGTGVYRVAENQVVALRTAPGWIAGFEGASTQESIGSLVAQIDGRNVPLTVGFHTVSVDVRDQIARTVIDESFVNHTGSELEGVFHFPLPADASISGFGMWIGDEYVEADIVEKQRAREIYETILREKRDPGLLEWTGGNVFKARVFPIPAYAEKRIQISYTQVLPRTGDRYRYSYALQSELLRQHPLRELGIDVKISSALPLAAVSSPTHATRVTQTEHAARVEFSAQEYTPDRDFEVVVELGQTASDVVLIPHQRGDDGYFMLQAMPAEAGASVAREVLPDGQPLKLLVLADTSRSMDRAARAAQSEFVAALLSSLSTTDQFNVGACDVECQWPFDRAVPADEGNVATARQMLDARVSLGWTDLDKAMAAALQQADATTHIIYVGDGIVTTGDADAVAFTKRLERLWAGHQATLHAVAVSSRYEAAVLKAMAAQGEGSLHRITGEAGPAAVALQLLAQLTQPAARIVKVEFPGLLTARVYPEEFPRLPAGTQQIVLGRYLPNPATTECDVVVTVQRGTESQELRTHASLKEAADGNSFIPRLWARMHLDALLEQGTSASVQEEIIALSEEYHIITPYTSLLVLETDADRQRFKVQRRFQMRDGERFFATGRDQVNYDLLQQQMRQAGDWRIRLRTAVLRELSTMGRPPIAQPTEWFGRQAGAASFGRYDFNSWWGDMGGMGMAGRGGGMPMGGRGDWAWDGDAYGLMSDGVVRQLAIAPSLQSVANGPAAAARVMAGDALGQLGEFNASGSERYVPLFGTAPFFDDFAGGNDFEMKQLRENLTLERTSDKYARDELSSIVAGRRRGTQAAGALGYVLGKRVYETMPAGKPQRLFERGSARRWKGETTEAPSWLGTLFPSVPSVPEQPKPAKYELAWPADARAIAESLLRTSQLQAIGQGFEITREVDYFQPRGGELNSHRHTTALVSPHRWLVRTLADTAQTVVHACDAQQREAYSVAFGLGRTRAATPQDLTQAPLELSGYMLSSLERDYRAYEPALERQDDHRTVLTLTYVLNPDSVLRFVIDTHKHVVESMETREYGEVTSSQTFGEFVEWAGAWWPTRSESFDAQGRRTTLVTQRFQLLDDGAFAARAQELQAGREQVQFIREPLPDTLAARKSVDEGKGTFEDHLVTLTHFYAIQQWDHVMRHLESLEALAQGKPGLHWVRDAVLADARRQEQLHERLAQRAAELAQWPTAEAGPDQEFLAQYLWSQASGVLETNDLLALLDSLKPVFDALPPRRHAAKQWRQYRIDGLGRIGQPDKVLELQKQQAVDYPDDASMQQQYIQALVQSRDFAAARNWLDQTLAGDIRWEAGEEESLRGVITQMYREQGRYDELVAYLAAWVATHPVGPSAYQQYLSALIKSDRIEEAMQVVDQYLAEGRQPDRLTKPVTARVAAAAELALGEGFELRTDRLDRRWLEPLADVVRAHYQDNPLPDVTQRIMSHHRFQDTQPYKRVRREIADYMTNQIDQLRIDRVQLLVNWVWQCDLDQAAWATLADRLRTRWDAESHPERKHVLGQVLAQVTQGKIGREEYLQLLRLQLAQGPEQYRTGYAATLFETLLSGPWSIEKENEAFALLPRLSDADDAFEKLAPQTSALQRLTDTMVQNRFQALMDTVANQAELTRTELADKQREHLKQARTQYAEQLKLRMRDAHELLVRWMNAEWIYLQVVLNENLSDVEQRCWEALGATPLKVDTGSALGDALQEALLTRYMMTLSNLAARREAKPELIERLLSYVEQGIALGDETSPAWKQHKYRLLIALDRSDELATALRQWIAQQDALAPIWQLSLGYLLAEQGKLAEAIASFEQLRSNDRLAGEDLKALADWYMAINDQDKYRQARTAALHQTEEWQLRDIVVRELQQRERLADPSQHVNPFGGLEPQAAVPSGVSDEVVEIFPVLFAKSSEPANHVDLLRQFYRATHDFRLLTGLADAVLGQSAGRIYPWLKQARHVLDDVREEAAVDSLAAHLVEVRQRATSDADQRALDLLELMVERRAADLVNQPGPHAQRALAALQRAGQRRWTPGEPRLMADYLAYLGRIPHSALEQAQTRQLESLHQQTESGTVDRLEIAHSLAQLYWAYGRQADATDLLQATLQEHQSARDGVLPPYANHVLSTYVDYLADRGLHALAEKTLVDQSAATANAQQTLWLRQRLAELYQDTLANDGEVSLGQGAELYHALVKMLQGELQHEDKEHSRDCIHRLTTVYRTAHEKKIPTAAQDLIDFARDQLPAALKRQVNEHQSLVGTVADTIRDLAGARESLAFLVRALNSEPRWFMYERRDGWNEHAWRLSQLLREVNQPDDAVELGDLEQPLLAVVIRELRRELESRQDRNRHIYWRHYGDVFWESQREAFLRTAETVYAENKEVPATSKYVAEYVAVGLDEYGRGIEMLFASLRDGTLDEDGQFKLVTWLHREDRYDESVPLLEQMIARSPDNMTYRVHLMYALSHTQRATELSALVEKTEAHFREKKLWNEGTLAPLADACVNCELFEQAITYYQELIPVHKRTQPNRGIGAGTLPQYCSQLARAYAGLGRTAEAVDAACEAIVSWGPQQSERRDALNALIQVLREAKDLDQYVQTLDQEAAEQGTDKPIVRKSLGIIFAEKEQWPAAIAQLKSAIQLQPDDRESHTKLIECYDAQGDQRGAIAQTLAAIDANPRSIDLCRTLGQRYGRTGATADEERAYTSIVELLPTESESHAMLAEIRQQQERWADAAVHWQQVARLRKLEPTGLLRLAAAQIRLQQWEAARETIRSLRSQTWPDRFHNVEADTRDLERRIERK